MIMIQTLNLQKPFICQHLVQFDAYFDIVSSELSMLVKRATTNELFQIYIEGKISYLILYVGKHSLS